jgi:tRNA A37 methylthiotransferase MiaB
VPRPLRRRRAAALRQLCERKQAAFLRGFDGTVAEVLIERTRDPRSGSLRGYTRNYTRVALAGSDALCGRRVRARLEVGAGRTVTGTVTP